jgi:acyl dehydratase
MTIRKSRLHSAKPTYAGDMSTCLSANDFSSPITNRWWEDYESGASYEFGFASASEEEIIEFARRFDPQPIHIDPHFAATGPFNGIIGSGAHTMALTMGLFVSHYISHSASLASPGGDELRWLAPLRPDEQLRIRCDILEARASSSKPDRGLIHTKVTTISETSGDIMTVTFVNFMKRRPENFA